MGRFKWLEVDHGETGSDKPKDDKTPFKGVSDKSTNISADETRTSKFGKTVESDGVIYDSTYFKNEGFNDYQKAEFDKALLNFSKCISENNKDEEAWIYQILTQIHLEKFSDALIWARKAYEFFGQSAEIQGILALALALNDSQKDALAYSDGAVAKNKPGYFVWYSRGEILLHQQNITTAQVCFKKCTEYKNPSGAINIDFEVAMSLLRAKRYAQSLSYFKKAIQTGLCNYFVYEKIGFLNESLEFLDEAEFYYRQSINLKGSNPNAIEGVNRVKSQNTFIIKIFNKIHKFFKLGGQKNE